LLVLGVVVEVGEVHFEGVWAYGLHVLEAAMGEGVGVVAVVREELCELERGADLEAGELVAGLDELVGVEVGVCAVVVDDHGVHGALRAFCGLCAGPRGGGVSGLWGVVGVEGGRGSDEGRGEDGLPFAGGGVEEDVAEDGLLAAGALCGGAVVPDAEPAVGLFDEEEAVVAGVCGAVCGEAGAGLAVLVALDAPEGVVEVGLVGEEGDLVARRLEEALEDGEAEREVLAGQRGACGAVALAGGALCAGVGGGARGEGGAGDEDGACGAGRVGEEEREDGVDSGAVLEGEVVGGGVSADAKEGHGGA
jgi:hypothetical protein